MIIVFMTIVACSATGQEKLEGRTRAFYDALNKGDSLEMLPFFHSNCRVKHVGMEMVWDLSLVEFLGVCPKFKSDYYSEDIARLEVHEFGGGLAYVDVYFDFYLEGSYSHSGIDHFCWSTREGAYRIESVYSSDFKGESPALETAKDMDVLMNKWHNDVAAFDYDDYFGFMTAEFIFLGTDPKERWTKSQFSTYAKPYFDRKSTWDFKTNWRNWYFSEDHKIAWFEESIATQMEECRGSGVLIKTDEGWKIAHYNLTVLIENEKMKKFIKLRRK